MAQPKPSFTPARTAIAGAVLLAATTFIGERALCAEPPSRAIACRLSALSPVERVREAELLVEARASTLETRELPTGYAFRFAPDPALFTRLAELVTLEHRCCPFLDFELAWAGGEAAPWLRVTGGDGVKAFVADAFRG